MTTLANPTQHATKCTPNMSSKAGNQCSLNCHTPYSNMGNNQVAGNNRQNQHKSGHKLRSLTTKVVCIVSAFKCTWTHQSTHACCFSGQHQMCHITKESARKAGGASLV